MNALRNICVIEDEIDIADSIKAYFEHSGFSVITFQSAEDYGRNVPKNFNGIYLVDWNLPGQLGVDLIKKIRENDKLSPIFIVSAYSQNDQIVEGLNSGADDYITKPFNLDELSVRVSNSLDKLSHIQGKLSEESFKLFPESSSFIKAGLTVALTDREFTIFKAMYDKLGEPLTRDDLINSFKAKDNITARNIDVHIFSLRKKIKTANMLIETVWGKGYKLIDL